MDDLLKNQDRILWVSVEQGPHEPIIKVVAEGGKMVLKEPSK